MEMKENNQPVVIKFDGVTKRYKLYKDDRQRLHAVFNKRVKPKIKEAICDMTFDIKRGESVALFGRNGAGKSTLLKMITGVIYPTEGEITVNGRVSALLELTAGFDPDFTGRENIYFRGQLMGIPKEEIQSLENTIIEFADIGDYMDQPVRTYSSGMKARLGFAINANVQPEILIVDEALSVGDKAFRMKCNQKIREILASGEVTFLFVTHTTQVAKDFCERGMVLKSGKLIFDDNIEAAADYYEEMVEAEIKANKKKKEKKTIMQM
ncbi:MAG: ABC transporter ATP-binding protein [Lachnospiraceae bacterium]|nr:ABC transporter ATP-binding protein [Lachnospiraceae bacterium]